MKKVFYFDTETTGLDPIKNGIIQFSGMVEIDGEVKETFNMNICPFPTDEINSEALAITGKTLPQLLSYPNPRHSFRLIEAMLDKYVDRYDSSDKFYPAGFNVRFDIDFLNQFFKKNFNNYFGSYFNWKAIDPFPVLHFLEYMGKIKLPNYKLKTVCEYYQIPIQAHDALSDIRATRELILKIKSIL